MVFGQKKKNNGSDFSGLTNISFANVIPSIIGGLFWLFMARLLGVEVYGQVSYIIAIASLATTLSGLGTGNTTLVFTAKGEKILSTTFFISVISITLASIIHFAIFHNIAAIVYIIGSAFFGLIISELLGLRAYQKYAMFSIIQRILMVGLSLGLYFLIGVNGIILGIGLSFLPFIFRIFISLKESKINFSFLRTKLPFMMNSYTLDLRSAFAGSVDKLIIVPFLGFFALGNYQLGIQIFSIMMIIPQIAYQYILPHDSKGEQKNKLKIITITIACCLTILAIILSPIVMPFLFPEFSEAVTVIQIISLSTISNSIVLMYLSKYLGNEKNRIMITGTGIYLAMQIIGILGLGHLFGINGIALAFVIASTAEALYFFIIDKKISDFRY